MLKSATDLAVFLNVRKNSRRCPNKMLRPFAGTTLIDLCLDKVSQLGWSAMYFGAHETELLEKASRYDCFTVVERSRESAEAASDAAKIFEILHSIPHRWVLWINPSHPFLSMNTVRKALYTFLELPHNSLTSVRQNRGWFYYSDGTPINNRDSVIDTKISEPLYEVAHAFHFYERAFMLNHHRPWANKVGDPYLFLIPDTESFDIDTEDEFFVAERLFERRNNIRARPAEES